MSKFLITLWVLGLLTTSCDSQWTQGQSTLSPSKKWFVRLESKATGATNGCARICLYDTDVYPSLKAQPPDGYQSGTPTASFTVPVRLEARSVDMKWNTNGTILRLEQPAPLPAIYYEVDLNSFSFTMVSK